MILPPIRRVALCCAISALLVHTSPAALENYWPLSEVSGSIAPNLAPSGVTGILFNDPTWINDPIRGQVLQFDGIDDFVDGGFSPQMTLTNDYTWSFWSNSVQPPTTGTAPDPIVQNNRIIVGNRYVGTGGDPLDVAQREFIKFTQTNLEFHRQGAANNLNYADMQPGEWIHSMAIKQGSTITYFRNGHIAGKTTITAGLNNPQPFYMGGNPATTGGRETWQGSLDDVATWTNAVPLSTVVKIAKGTATPETAPAQLTFATVMSDDFSNGLGQWFETNRGLERNGEAGFNPATTTDGKLTLGGTATAQYWYGKSLESIDVFDATVESIISVDRVSLTGGGPATSGRYRSSLWLLGDNDSYLHFSQNIGEGGWTWNARDEGGLGTLNPTGAGNNIVALDTKDSDGGQFTMSLQLVPTGIPGDVFVYMLLNGEIVASHEFTNFPSTFQVVLTGQARAIDDNVSAVFDNLTVAQAVPERSTALLLGAAGIGVFSRRRRNKLVR